MLFLIFVAVVAALSATLYLFLSYRYSSWKRKGVAGPPATAFPLTIPKHIIGKEHYGDVVDRIYNQFRKSPIAGTYVFGRPVLHLHDPEIIKQVLIKEFQDFNGRGMYNDSDQDPISHGLFFLSGPKWRRLRVKLAPAFTSGKIKYMFETIQKSSEQLTKYLDDRIAAGGGSYCENSRPLMKRLFVDTLSEVIFGIESNVVQNPDSAFHKAIQKIVEPTLSNMWRLVMITFASDVKSFLRIHAVSAEIERFYTTLVRDSINYREQNKIERADILNLMMQLKNQGFVAPDRDDKKEENGRADLQRMTMDDIAAQAFIFVSAGFETSSTATSCTLYEIAKNPKILEKVLSEIDRVLSEFDGKISYESVMSMPYLEMCINETLRKYPALPYVSRQAMVKRKIPLTDVVVEKDTLLIVPVRALNYDPEYWPDPERYDPERFSEEQKASRSSGLVYMPFGEGPRICIAGRLGLVQVKTALATVLSKYTVSIPSDSGSKLSMEPRSFSNAPGTPLNVIFKPRKPMYFIRGKAA